MRHVQFRTTILTALLLIGTATAMHGQDTLSERLLTSDPQQLLELARAGGQVMMVNNIADFENRDVREAPAFIQVITARHIEASGATTLYEALQLVPGMSFGRDNDDMIGVGIHGNWAGDGKCLFLLDGRQLNENDLGFHAIGHRVPLANVERIEVVMGPSSVSQGGFAALGVVNIVTRTADQGTGSKAEIHTGYSAQDMTRTGVNFSGAHRIGIDQDISYLASHTRGRRSNALRLLPDSTLLDFADSTGMEATSFQLNYRWKDLKASVVYMEETFAVSDAQYSMHLSDLLIGIEYSRKLGQLVDMVVKLDHTDQKPWNHVNTNDPVRSATNTNNQRTSAYGSVTYRPWHWLSARLGANAFHQHTAYTAREATPEFRMSGGPAVDMNDVALFMEVGVRGKFGALSAGYRYEFNDLSGQFVAPRVGYTKVLGRFHMKLLYGEAFRSPTVMNLNYSAADTSLRAERVTTYEGELGVKIGNVTSLTVNGYGTSITDPIVRATSGPEINTFVNREGAGSTGADVRFNTETKRTTILAGYGLYQTMDDARVAEYQLPDSLSSGFQGLPTQRAFLVLAYQISPSLTLHSRTTWRSELWSYQRTTTSGTALEPVRSPEELIVNAGLIIRPKASARITLNLGCRNVLDQQRTLLSPMGNGNTPFALNGREWTFSFIYRFVQ